jgi:hypothetical protein
MAGRGALTGETETKPDNRRRQGNRGSSYGRAREAIGRDKPGGPISSDGESGGPWTAAATTVRCSTDGAGCGSVRGSGPGRGYHPDGSRSDTSCG